MSFDLYFYCKKENTLEKEELLNYFNDIPSIEINSLENGLTQLMYENEDTSVYFLMDYSEETEELEESLNVTDTDYRYTGLSTSINYLRPSFFALEIMPLITKFVNDFDLLIVNPQLKDENSTIPKRYSEEQLISSWTDSNKWAVSISRDTNILYLPKEKSVSIWKYLKEKSILQDKLGDTYFVPRIFIIKRANSDELYRAITWNQSIPQVIPECDLIIVLREKAGFWGFGKKQEKGLVEYSRLIDKMGSLLEPFDGPIQGMKILNPRNYENALRIFNKIDIVTCDSLEGISLDSIIDVSTDK